MLTITAAVLAVALLGAAAYAAAGQLRAERHGTKREAKPRCPA